MTTLRRLVDAVRAAKLRGALIGLYTAVQTSAACDGASETRAHWLAVCAVCTELSDRGVDVGQTFDDVDALITEII